MARRRPRGKAKPAPLSKEAQRVQEDNRRIARELAAVRRVAQLAKRLEHAFVRAEVNTFALGRELVTARGFVVVAQEHSRFLQAENEQLRKRIAQLEAALDPGIYVPAEEPV